MPPAAPPLDTHRRAADRGHGGFQALDSSVRQLSERHTAAHSRRRLPLRHAADRAAAAHAEAGKRRPLAPLGGRAARAEAQRRRRLRAARRAARASETGLLGQRPLQVRARPRAASV